MKALGVSRQTVLQRVKRGQLRAVHVHRGRQPGLRNRSAGDHAGPLRTTLKQHGGIVTMVPRRL